MTARSLVRIVPAVMACLFFSLPSLAVQSTSVFSDMNLVTENLAQEFYRAWHLRLAELPENYQQISHGTSVEFLSPRKEGCAKPSVNSQPLPVAAIRHAARRPQPDTLEEVTAYDGCSGRTVVSEIVRVKGRALVETPLDDVLSGKRRFLRDANETERISIVSDPARGPVITVVSRKTPHGQTTQILILQQPLITVTTSQLTPTKSLSEIDLEDFHVRFSSAGSSINSNSRGMKMKLSVLNDAGTLYFRMGDEPDYTSQIRIEKAYSDSVVFAVDVTAVSILDLYLSQLPTTAVAKPAAGANQRILSELNLALSRLTSKTEIEQVRILIQQYLSSIESGDISIEDHRPK